MDPEQRIPAVVEHAVIERLVFVICALGGLFRPKRVLIVDGKILDGFFLILFTLLLSFLLALCLSLLMEPVSLGIDEIDVCGSEITILAERHPDSSRIEDLDRFLGKLQCDDRSPVLLL